MSAYSVHPWNCTGRDDVAYGYVFDSEGGWFFPMPEGLQSASYGVTLGRTTNEAIEASIDAMDEDEVAPPSPDSDMSDAAEAIREYFAARIGELEYPS